MFKFYLRKYSFFLIFISKVAYLYLKIVYFTSRWKFFWLDKYTKGQFLAEQGSIFALWHNKLIFAPGVFLLNKNTQALISPHADGKIIAEIVKNFGFKSILGSTNKNPNQAIKIIIARLLSGNNILITPDGPRGPTYQINSNIIKLAKKYQCNLIPISIKSNFYFSLKSWDKLVIPLPFGKILVSIGSPIKILGNEEFDKTSLITRLNSSK